MWLVDCGREDVGVGVRIRGCYVLDEGYVRWPGLVVMVVYKV